MFDSKLFLKAVKLIEKGRKIKWDGRGVLNDEFVYIKDVDLMGEPSLTAPLQARVIFSYLPLSQIHTLDGIYWPKDKGREEVVLDKEARQDGRVGLSFKWKWTHFQAILKFTWTNHGEKYEFVVKGRVGVTDWL